ncbi:addiction module protein [Arcobacter sp. YIC-464]|uniref:addiction module protein n=1 Tax=Arcobacter sp. YIC-464 TaxID=3376631 RepID=UPI003C1C490B
MSINQNTQKELMDLNPIDKIKLIDELLLSLDIPDKTLDKEWAKEVEDRIDAYEKNEIETVSHQDVFSKYE